jgi:FeS assembly SUF system protein
MQDPIQNTDTQTPGTPTANTHIISSIEKNLLKAQVIDVIMTCYDPEIPVNVYELGLIYDVIVDDHANVEVKMTLTSPSCPAAQSLPPEVQQKISFINGLKQVKVTLVWDPPWNPGLMSEAAKLELGFM